jgi:protein-disulfide isomerase
MSRQSDRRQTARVARERLARQQRKQRVLWASIAALVIVLIAGAIGWGVYASQQADEDFAVPANAASDRTGVKIGSGPVTVDIYLDYLCPACQQFEAATSATQRKYLDEKRITLVVHPVAILDRYSTNEYSSRSATGAGCAAEQGKVFEYSEALYADQPAEGGPGHTDEKLADLAAGAGLDKNAFAACQRSQRYGDWVKFVTASMDQRGVTGTPTVFVNGKKLTSLSDAALRSAVDAA